MEYLKFSCILVYGIAILIFIIMLFREMLKDNPFAPSTQSNYGLGRDDYDFLIKLQNELITQDHVGQAAPRFWVVQGTERVFCGPDYGTDGEILYRDGDDLADDLDEAVQYFNDHFGAEFEENDIVIEPDAAYGGYAVIKHKEDDDLMVQESACTVSELIDALVEYGIIDDADYSSACFKYEPHIYPNTLFLTNRSCKEHIAANHYHYSDDAHSYAMTAWRSPEVQRLWEILERINWELLKEDVYGADATESSGDSEQS